MGAGSHDDLVGALQGHASGGGDLQQLVARKVGEVVECLDALLAERHQSRRVEAAERRQRVIHAEFDPPARQLLVALGQELERAIPQLFGDLFVEPLDLAQVLDRHVGDLLDRGEALGDQQVGDHVVDVQGIDERLRTGAELLGAAMGFLVFGEDGDVPAGELRGEPNILAAPPDRQAELLVGHDHLDPARVLVDHHLGHLGRGQGVDDECRRIRRPLNDIDLFALQLADHRLHAGTAHADAGADGIDRRFVRIHRDLGPGARVAGHRLDLDDPLVDFRHFLGEQLGHEL